LRLDAVLVSLYGRTTAQVLPSRCWRHSTLWCRDPRKPDLLNARHIYDYCKPRSPASKEW